MIKTIKIWNPKDGKWLKTLEGHENAVYCVIELKNGNIASASWDKTIKNLES